MVTVRIAGGLGNQLFQYAAALAVAERNRTTVTLDCRFEDGNSVRHLQLDGFEIPAAHQPLAPRRSPPLERLRASIWKRIDKNKPWYARKVVVEPQIDFSPDLRKASGDIYLRGYFQSYRYFDGVEELLRRQCAFRAEAAPLEPALVEEIGRSESVALHVRRGDYLREDCTMLLCPAAYYRQAVANLEQARGNLKIFVFSEDLAWCRENLSDLGDVRFVSLPSDLCEFRHMSLCKHHIISNSTFSWWSAWLASDPDKLVLAPKRWYKTRVHRMEDLIPPTWLTL